MSARQPDPTASGLSSGADGDADGFTLDEALRSRRRAASTRRLHTLQIPILRAIGFLILSAIIAVQDALGGPPLPVAALVAMNLIYAAAAWAVLRAAWGRTGAVDPSLVLFHLDLLVWLVLLYWLEPRNTFFAYFLLVRVVDQVGFGFRRALYFAHVVPIAYLGYAAWAAWAASAAFGAESAAVGWSERLTIAAMLYLLGLYMSATGLVTERLRQRTRQAVRAARSLVEGLNRQAHDLQTQATELQEARRQAEAANRAKSQFLAVTSHEVRTPMNGILGATELLMETPLSAVQKRYVKTVHRSATALLALIDDVLDLSRIDAGKLQLTPQPVDLPALVEETVELVRVATRERPLVLQVELPARLPARLQADPLRLRQVLLNLLHNAVKFTDRGSVRLVVRVLAESADGLRLRFSVHDTGIGIAEDQLGSIFGSFTQVDGSSTRRHGGSGLGLAIVKDVTRLMGGSVGVESRLGHGSHFWIDLPLGRAPEPALGDDGAASPAPFGDSDAPVHVLLVEDDPINRMVVEDMLRVLGCEVTNADDGAAGLAAVEAGGHDIVFMDCHMPTMDGYEATRAIRAGERSRGVGARLPIVALTADTLASDRERALGAGMDDFLSKPVSRAQLATTIRRWTGRRTNPTTQW